MLSLPHLHRAVAQHRQPMPRAHAVRMARRLVAARRWGCRQPQPAAVLTPALQLGTVIDARDTSRLRREALPLMAACWEASAAATPLTDCERQCLASGDADAVFSALIDREQRRVEAAIAPIAALCDGYTPITFAALHMEPLLELASIMRSGSGMTDAESIERDGRIVVELVDHFCIETSLDFDSAPGRVLLAIWNDLARSNRYLVAPQHVFEALAPWQHEMMTDAARDGRWEGDRFIPDPQALEALMENAGYEDRDDAIAYIASCAKHARWCQSCKPISPNSAIAKQWLAANPGPVADRLTALAALARLSRKVAPQLEDVRREYSGQVGAIACLFPPLYGDVRDVIEQDLSTVGQGEAEQVELSCRNLRQLFAVLPAAAMELAIAHAALTITASIPPP